MTVEWRQPYSDVVTEIGYDSERSELFVRWRRGGKTSVYAGVTWEEFDHGSRAPSVGSWLSADIKPSHPHRYAT